MGGGSRWGKREEWKGVGSLWRTPTHNSVPPTNMGRVGTRCVTETNTSSERESGVEERNQAPMKLGDWLPAFVGSSRAWPFQHGTPP